MPKHGFFRSSAYGSIRDVDSCAETPTYDVGKYGTTERSQYSQQTGYLHLAALLKLRIYAYHKSF